MIFGVVVAAIFTRHAYRDSMQYRRPPTRKPDLPPRPTPLPATPHDPSLTGLWSGFTEGFKNGYQRTQDTPTPPTDPIRRATWTDIERLEGLAALRDLQRQGEQP